MSTKRKEKAARTLKIQNQGYYEIDGNKIDISEQQKFSEENSILFTPEENQQLLQSFDSSSGKYNAKYTVLNQSVVQTLYELSLNYPEDKYAILNFASAKNPGGGFLNGAKAQEEDIASSSGLYNTLIKNQEYYTKNREFKSMIYTNHAIYSPDVVFFRNSKLELIQKPFLASVLTMPAVNMGQVILKGEDQQKARIAMKERMRICLNIFAHMKQENLILGAYGCGVFRNDPEDVARWWKEILDDYGYKYCFKNIIFSVLDRSKTLKNINIFKENF